MAQPPESDDQIFELASECEKLFKPLVSGETDSILATLFSECQQRFATWAAYLGVFARPSQCLDRRLHRLPDIKDIVVRLLDSLGTSLGQCKHPHWSLPDVWIKTKSHGALVTLHQRDNGITPGEAVKDLENDEPSLFAKETLINIEDTLNRLNLLGVTIRESTRTGIEHKVNGYVKTVDLTSIDDIFSTSVQSLYPNAHHTLRNILSSSMTRKYGKLIYKRARHGDLSTRRDTTQKQSSAMLQIPQLSAPTTPKAEGPWKVGILPNSSRVFQQSGPSLTPLSSVETGALHRKLHGQRQLDTKTHKTSSVLINQGNYPIPPDKKSYELICEFCSQPLEKKDLEGKRWSQHIDRDIRPYICLIEDCRESIRDYATFEQWYDHMSQHGHSWHREHYQVPTWVCPMCEDERLFSNPSGLFAHMEEMHIGQFTGTQLQIIAQGSRIYKLRAKDECPICAFEIAEEQPTDKALSKRPREGTPEDSNKRVKITNREAFSRPEASANNSQARLGRQFSKAMAKHIASHLQGLMFITIRIASVQNDDLSSQQGDSDIKSDAIDMEDGVLSTDDANMSDFLRTRSFSEEPDSQDQMALQRVGRRVTALLDKCASENFRSRPKYSDVIKQWESLHNGFDKPPELHFLEHERSRHENWVEKAKGMFGKSGSTDDAFMRHLKRVLNQNMACFDTEIDVPRLSGHMIFSDDTFEPSSTTQDPCCICRLAETGRMIECQACNECYHTKCLEVNVSEVDEIGYKCPICDGTTAVPHSAARPGLEDLISLWEQVQELPFRPEEEEILNVIIENSQSFRDHIAPYCDQPAPPGGGTQLQKFYLRKLEGAGVLLARETRFLRQEIINGDRWERERPVNRRKGLEGF